MWPELDQIRTKWEEILPIIKMNIFSCQYILPGQNMTTNQSVLTIYLEKAKIQPISTKKSILGPIWHPRE